MRCVPEGHCWPHIPGVTLPQLFQYPLIIETPGCDNDIQHLMLKMPGEAEYFYSFRTILIMRSYAADHL